jgi:hypothetical protein
MKTKIIVMSLCLLLVLILATNVGFAGKKYLTVRCDTAGGGWRFDPPNVPPPPGHHYIVASTDTFVVTNACDTTANVYFMTESGGESGGDIIDNDSTRNIILSGRKNERSICLTKYGKAYLPLYYHIRFSDVPSLTQWGIIILVVLMVASGIFIMVRRRKAAVPA